MPTIKDVAKEAGVSIATVSNIMNNKASVSEETYQKVYEAIEKLDYKPNMLARNLKSNGVKFLGVIVPTFLGIYQDILEGIQRELSEYGFYIISRTTGDIPNREQHAIDEFISLGVCGIFAVTSFKDICYYQKAVDARIPVIFIERTVDELNFSSVVFDNRSLSRGIFNSLLDGGCDISDIYLITGEVSFSSERDFVVGAQNALLQHNYTEEELKQCEVSFSEIQSFVDIMEVFDGISVFPKYLVLTSERILDSVLEMFSVKGVENVQIYVPTGDRWNSCQMNPMIHPIPRRAIYGGRKCAQLMLEFIRKPTANENLQMVIPTELPKRKPLIEKGAISGGELRLLLTANAMSSAILKLIPGFTRETGITIETKVFNYQQELYDEIMKQHEEGSSYYDIYMMDSPWIEYFRQIKCVLPLNVFLTQDLEYVHSFVPDIWNKIQGRNRDIMGIPIVSMTQLLLYRKDLFSSPALQRAFYKIYGLEMNLPATWTEYNLLARFFTRQYFEHSPTEYGTCLQGKKPNGIIQEFFPRQWSFHAEIMNKTKVVMNSVQNIRAVSNLKDTYAYSYPDIWDLMENEQIAEFAKGNIAMINTYSGHFKSILDSGFRCVGDNIGVSVLPGKYSLIGAWLLTINSRCKNPEKAFSFIKWITTEERAMQCSILGGFMPKQSVCMNEQIKTIYPWNESLGDYVKMEHQRESLRNVKGTYINNYTIENIIADGLQAVLQNKCEIEVMLQNCQEQIYTMIHEWK